MKKLAIIVVLLSIVFSYSCKKDKLVSTTINGTLLTNGTNDPIKLSTELTNPIVILFHRTFSGSGLGGSYIASEIARTTVNNNASFSFNIDLYEEDEYFLGYANVNSKLYYYTYEKWNGYQNYYPVTPGGSNSNIKLLAPAYSWVQPRFINTNTNPTNNDVFDLIDGIGSPGPGTILNNFIGPTDTTMSWIHETWSGQSLEHELPHQVQAKLTRNGITKDTIIPYFAPPFDTSIVVIRY